MAAAVDAPVVVALTAVAQVALTVAAVDPCAVVSNQEVVQLLSHKMYAYEV